MGTYSPGCLSSWPLLCPHSLSKSSTNPLSKTNTHYRGLKAEFPIQSSALETYTIHCFVKHEKMHFPLILCHLSRLKRTEVIVGQFEKDFAMVQYFLPERNRREHFRLHPKIEKKKKKKKAEPALQWCLDLLFLRIWVQSPKESAVYALCYPLAFTNAFTNPSAHFSKAYMKHAKDSCPESLNIKAQRNQKSSEQL